MARISGSKLNKISKDMAYRKKVEEQNKKQTKRKYNNRINKALGMLDDSDKLVAELSNSIPTRKQYNTDKIKNELYKMKDRVEKKGKLTTTQFARLKQLSSKKFYGDNVEMKMEVPDEARSKNSSVEITKSEWIRLSAAKRISDKDYKISTGKTDKVFTPRDAAIFKEFSRAYNTFANIENAVDMRDVIAIPETEEDVIKMLKEKRGTSQLDLSFGGHSSLLNDLAYTAGARGDLGRDFVSWVRALMEGDKVIFAKIEKWYQSPAGKTTRDYINNAVGDNWYENYKEFSILIEKVMEELQIELNLAPDEFSEDIIREAEARSAGFMDGYSN